MSLQNDYGFDKAGGMQGVRHPTYVTGRGVVRNGPLQSLASSLEAMTIQEVTAPMTIANSRRNAHPRVRASLSIENQSAASPLGYSKSFVDKRVTLYKTEMCRAFEETGLCRYGSKCQFAHSQGELRKVTRHPRYKTEICKTYWEVGSCPYGKRCCFIHNESDLLGSSHDTGDGSFPGAFIGDLPAAALPKKLESMERPARLIYERTLNAACTDELCEDHLWEDESVSGQIPRDLMKLLDD